MSSKVSVSIWWKNLLPAEKFMLVAAGVFGLLVLLGLLIFLPVGKVINKVSEDKVTKGYSKMVPDWVRGGWAYQRVVKYTQHGSFPKNTGSVIIPKALAILNKSVSQHVKDRWVFNKVPVTGFLAWVAWIVTSQLLRVEGMLPSWLFQYRSDDAQLTGW